MSFIHRCQYEGGVVFHDLTEIVFEIVPGTMASSLLKQQSKMRGSKPEALSPPSSPLKADVVARGRVAVWEQPKSTKEAIADAHQELKDRPKPAAAPNEAGPTPVKETPHWHRTMLEAEGGGKLANGAAITITALDGEEAMNGAEAVVFFSPDMRKNEKFFDYTC